MYKTAFLLFLVLLLSSASADTRSFQWEGESWEVHAESADYIAGTGQVSIVLSRVVYDSTDITNETGGIWGEFYLGSELKYTRTLEYDSDDGYWKWVGPFEEKSYGWGGGEVPARILPNGFYALRFRIHYQPDPLEDPEVFTQNIPFPIYDELTVQDARYSEQPLYVDSNVTFSGKLMYEKDRPASGAEMTLAVPFQSKLLRDTTDSNGGFEFQFHIPGSHGNFTVSLAASVYTLFLEQDFPLESMRRIISASDVQYNSQDGELSMLLANPTESGAIIDIEIISDKPLFQDTGFREGLQSETTKTFMVELERLGFLRPGNYSFTVKATAGEGKALFSGNFEESVPYPSLRDDKINVFRYVEPSAERDLATVTLLIVSKINGTAKFSLNETVPQGFEIRDVPVTMTQFGNNSLGMTFSMEMNDDREVEYVVTGYSDEFLVQYEDPELDFISTTAAAAPSGGGGEREYDLSLSSFEITNLSTGEEERGEGGFPIELIIAPVFVFLIIGAFIKIQKELNKRRGLPEIDKNLLRD
jgi:hypothetical protein